MNLKYLFLFSILILVYIFCNILIDFNKTVEKATRIQKERSSFLIKPPLPQKEAKIFKEPITAPKPSPIPEANYSVESVSEGHSPHNDGEYHDPQPEEEADDLSEGQEVEDRPAIGICHTYLYLCKESEIMFGYKENLEDEESRIKGSQVIQCITNVTNCMDEYQEISLEEELLIIEQAKIQKGVQ